MSDENQEKTLLTLRETLAHLRHYRDIGDLNDYWGTNLLRRLEIVEQIIPQWLDFHFSIHPLADALDSWDVNQFSILIGRAAVYPTQVGWEDYFKDKDAQGIWEFAQSGLGGDRAESGQKPKLDKWQQRVVYDLWSKSDLTQEDLANMYKVSRMTIRRAIERWKKELGDYKI